MHWTALVTAHQLYNQHEKFDATYRAFLNDPDGPDWWGPGAPTAPQVDRVLLFVNQWKSRVKRDPQTVAELRVGLLRAKNLLQPLRRRTILDVDFDDRTVGAVAGAFDAILESLPTRNATAASNILHMFNRLLFVMWDEGIRSAYGVGSSGIGYAKLFLPEMQVAAQER